MSLNKSLLLSTDRPCMSPISSRPIRRIINTENKGQTNIAAKEAPNKTYSKEGNRTKGNSNKAIINNKYSSLNNSLHNSLHSLRMVVVNSINNHNQHHSHRIHKTVVANSISSHNQHRNLRIQIMVEASSSVRDLVCQ